MTGERDISTGVVATICSLGITRRHVEQSDEATLVGEFNKKCREERIKVKLKWDIRNAVSVS